MILQGMTSAQRYSRVFKDWTRLSLQIKAVAATISLSTNQGEAQTPNDGVQISQSASSNNNPSYDFWWKGELWYSASQDNTPFVLLIIGTGSPS